MAGEVFRLLHNQKWDIHWTGESFWIFCNDPDIPDPGGGLFERDIIAQKMNFQSNVPFPVFFVNEVTGGYAVHPHFHGVTN